jgi:hypothetical protein
MSFIDTIDTSPAGASLAKEVQADILVDFAGERPEYSAPKTGKPPALVPDAGLRLVPAGQLDGVGNRPEALFDARLRGGVDPEHPYARLPLGDPVRIFDGELRFANTAQAHEGHASGGLGTSLVDLVENVFTVDEIGIAGEGDGRGGGRRRFPSF